MDMTNATTTETVQNPNPMHAEPRKSAAEILAIVRAGGIAYVPSYTRVLVINAKSLAAFEKAGQWLIKDDADGRGYRVRQGKGSVYVFVDGLKTKTAA